MRSLCLAVSLAMAASPVLAQFRGKTNLNNGGNKPGRVKVGTPDSLNGGVKGQAPTLITPGLAPLGRNSSAKPSVEAAAAIGLPVSAIGSPIGIKTPSQTKSGADAGPRNLSGIGNDSSRGRNGSAKVTSDYNEGPEHFVIVLNNLGIPSNVTDKISAYLKGHAGLTRRKRLGVASLAAMMGENLLGKGLNRKELAVFILAAAIRDIDPSDAKAVEILGDFSHYLGTPSEILSKTVSAILKETRSRAKNGSLDKMEKDYRDAIAETSSRPAARKKLNAMADLLAYSDRLEPYIFGSPSEIDEADPALAADSNYSLLPPGFKDRFDKTAETLEREGPVAPIRFEGALAQNRGPPDALLASAAELAESLSGGSTGKRVPDAVRARNYVSSIMGPQKITPKLFQDLVLDFMQNEGIDPDSARGRAVIAKLIPSKASADAKSLSGIDPRFKHFGSLILKLSRDYEMTPAHVESLIKTSGLTGFMSGTKNKDQLESVLDKLLRRDQIETFVSKYPENTQGNLMRMVAQGIMTPGGKSIEEITRSGVFVYADVFGSDLRNASVGRDPDDSSRQMTFYVTFTGEKWVIGGYLQRGPRNRPDSEMVESFQTWLLRAGIPQSHL